MDVAQDGILRINHLRDRTSDAELRETYQSLLNTFLAMKAFAEGITDSEARKKVGVNAFSFLGPHQECADQAESGYGRSKPVVE